MNHRETCRIMAGMEMEFTADDSHEKPPSQKAGAAKGNRTAWKHGRHSAAAKAARAKGRAEIVSRLLDAADMLVSGEALRSRPDAIPLVRDAKCAMGRQEMPGGRGSPRKSENNRKEKSA